MSWNPFFALKSGNEWTYKAPRPLLRYFSKHFGLFADFNSLPLSSLQVPLAGLHDTTSSRNAAMCCARGKLCEQFCNLFLPQMENELNAISAVERNYALVKRAFFHFLRRGVLNCRQFTRLRRVFARNFLTQITSRIRCASVSSLNWIKLAESRGCSATRRKFTSITSRQCSAECFNYPRQLSSKTVSTCVEATRPIEC